MAALEKVYPCLTCGQSIKLERKDNKWLRWNLEGTAHVDQKKKQPPPQQQQPTITSSASTAQPAPPATTTSSSLERKLDDLIAQVQALRLDLQKNRK